MRVATSCRTLAALLFMTAPSFGTIRPFWRVNPISPAAIAEAPVLANALSVSLMVELSGGAQFNIAALDLNPLYGGGRFYQNVKFGPFDIGAPNPLLFPLSPALEFDTYVSVADRTITTQSPGRYHGLGPPQVGNSNLEPSSGDHRTGEFFNVAWGGPPVTGSAGVHEIARITTIGNGSMLISLTLDDGQVRDNLSPNVGVALPPIPVAVVPEPGLIVIASVPAALLRRRVRGA